MQIDWFTTSLLWFILTELLIFGFFFESLFFAVIILNLGTVYSSRLLNNPCELCFLYLTYP